MSEISRDPWYLSQSIRLPAPPPVCVCVRVHAGVALPTAGNQRTSPRFQIPHSAIHLRAETSHASPKCAPVPPGPASAQQRPRGPDRTDSPQYQPHRVVSATNSSRNTTIRTTTLHLNPACRIQNCSRPYCCAVSAAPLPALPVNGTYVLYPRIVMTPSSRSLCHKLDDSRRVHPDDSNATSI
ncbi:hypothetical protein V2G26_001196 [Clonostachys chloroleuca]